MAVLLLGIDWGDQKHDVCIMNEAGTVLASFTIPHSQEGLEQLRDRVRTLQDAETEVLCAIETNQGLLVNFLLEQGWTVYAINPKSADRYRDRTRTVRAKSDQLDGWVLADILRTDRHLHRPLLPDSELAREIRELTRGRDSLVQEQTRLHNQLKACLKAYWPEALSFLPDLLSLWALAFLLRFPTLEDAQKASLKVLQAFLRERKHPQWRTKAQEIYDTLRGPHITVPDYLVRTRSRQMQHLAKQLLTVVQDIKAYDEEIERLLKEHPDGQLFLSLPGAGPNLAARMLAEIGDRRERYATANSLQCEAGTAPVTRKSGKSLSVVSFRRACKKPLRQALHLFAGCSIRRCSWAHALYEQQRAKGKRHHEAVRAVAHKWAKIIFAMWQSKTCYDERIYLAARKQFLERSSAA
nr:MAG: IS110 family transposase [Bacillota bacterium]